MYEKTDRVEVHDGRYLTLHGTILYSSRVGVTDVRVGHLGSRTWLFQSQFKLRMT